MPLSIRRIIFAFFVSVFIISASAILFYGSGYRWNGAKHTIEKTGQLSLDSRPKGADIFLNGEVLGGTWKKFIGSAVRRTPANVKNLLPGEYHVEIQKDGYYPWKKDVRIFSGQTALFHGIRLLKRVPPEQILSGGGIQFSRVSDTAYALLTREDLYLYDQRHATVRSVFHSGKKPLLLFSARSDGMQFFLRAQDRQWIVNADGRSVELPHDSGRMLSRVRWSLSGEFFGQTSDAVVTVVLANGASLFKKIINEAPDDFTIRGTRFFSIQGGKKKSVQMRDMSRPQIRPVEIMSLEMGGKFLNESSEDIAVQKSGGGVVILSPARIGNTFEILELENVTQLSEKKDSEFLGWNDVELWRYTLFGREYGKTLLTRQGMTVQKAFFSHIVPAVFFLSDNALTLVSMSEGDIGSQTRLFQWDAISDVALSKDEKEFFISGTYHGAQGFYRLQIMD